MVGEEWNQEMAKMGVEQATCSSLPLKLVEKHIESLAELSSYKSFLVIFKGRPTAAQFTTEAERLRGEEAPTATYVISVNRLALINKTPLQDWGK